MTASALGDFLKRILGMGYASWMNISSNNNNPTEEDSFEGPTATIEDIDTEVEVALPLSAYWNTDYNALLNHLEQYHRIWRLVKRNTEFSFIKEVI
jgi:hypothetical protein